jgi:hypothetical protein
MFHGDGVVNRHNYRIWVGQNSHVTCELERGSPRVNTWASIMHNKFIGLFFFSEKTMTGRLYLDMLELYAFPQLPPQTIIQDDVVPPHYCHNVRNHLDREMAMRWIDKGGPISRPPRSPDLTALDFLWSYVKNIIYQVKINNIQHLKAHIRDAVAMVTPNVLRATWKKVECRLDICLAHKEAHIEIY